MSQHEQFLVLHMGGSPLFVTEYPATLKPFYARPVDGNPDIVSARTHRHTLTHTHRCTDTLQRDPIIVQVAAADLLVPGIGELAGGSMREERHHMLEQRLMDMGMADSYQWSIKLTTACISSIHVLVSIPIYVGTWSYASLEQCPTVDLDWDLSDSYNMFQALDKFVM